MSWRKNKTGGMWWISKDMVVLQYGSLTIRAIHCNQQFYIDYEKE